MNTSKIDILIKNERKAIQWYFGWCVLLVGVGSLILAAYFINSSSANNFKDWSPALGGGFILTLTKFPLMEVLKRRDRIAALTTLRDNICHEKPDSPEASRVDDIVWAMLKKMTEG